MFMNTSYSQAEKILADEDFSATAYKDGMSGGVQMYSIGYGHQIRSNESYLLSATIDKDAAYKLFLNDLSPIEDQINSDAVYPLNQNQFDALVDFGYNCGSGALANILDTWNETNDPGQTTARMQLYNKTRDSSGNLVVSDNLTGRRADETELFQSIGSAVTGNPGATAVVLLAVAGAAFLLFRS